GEEVVHRLGERDDLGGALDLDPGPEERVGHHGEEDLRVPPQIACLDRGLAAADHQVTLRIAAHQHGGHLRTPVGMPGEHDRAVIGPDELTRLFEIHITMMHPRLRKTRVRKITRAAESRGQQKDYRRSTAFRGYRSIDFQRIDLPPGTLPLVLPDDRGRVPAADAVLLGEPVGPLLAAEKRWPVVYDFEPLSEISPGDLLHPGDELALRLRRVVHGHCATSTGKAASSLSASPWHGICKTQPSPASRLLIDQNLTAVHDLPGRGTKKRSPGAGERSFV